jgi:hypothetical protein
VANLIRINVDEAENLRRTDLYGTGAIVRLESSATEAGTYASVGTATLQDDVDQYLIGDPAGTEATWYRTRYENAGGTVVSAYSDPFQVGGPAAYASVESLREMLGLPDDSRDNLLADCLRRASGWITDECHRSFFRHPAVTGTEQRTYHLDADAREIEDDIVSLTTVESAPYTGAAYVALGGTDWVLVPAEVDGVPYEALRLSDVGVAPYLYRGYATVRLTGVFGFPEVPPLIEQATLDLARELYQQGPGGRTVGMDFGRLPTSVQRAIARYARHSFAHV